MTDFARTKKGMELPLISLKGKPYLLVGHRLVWLNDEVPLFDIETEFLVMSDEQTVARAKVTLKDDTGKILKTATATKRETLRDFSDHTEKAETSAVGRALAMLGFGTQFALADLDEGSRLADSPIQAAKKELVAGTVIANANVALARKKVTAAEHAAIKEAIKSGESLTDINNEIQRRMKE